MVPVLVTGCALGEVVATDWAFAPEPFRVCRACDATTYSLWADVRAAAAAAAASLADANGSKASTAGLGECRKCPDHAACAGGPSLLPRLGWWHSSPTSAQMHKCVYADACLGPGALRPATASGSGGGTVAVADGRVNAVLRACQEAWYASRPAGADVMSLLAKRLALVQGNGSSSSAGSSSLLQVNGSGSGSGNNGSRPQAASAFSTCLLWGAPGDGSEVAASPTGPALSRDHREHGLL